ncbi:MAG: hypothetical protein RLP44_24190, partial [Aggregatilineales bacterium]
MYKKTSLFILITVFMLFGIGLSTASAQAFPTTPVSINFQITGSPIPAGYAPDFGDAFGAR